MDRFSALIIYLSLIALAEDPLLWDQCRADDESKLLLGMEDFQDLKNSVAYQLLRGKRSNVALQKCLAELANSIEEARMPRTLSEVIHTPSLVFPSKFYESKKFLLSRTSQHLSNLFENDPLYAFPRSRKARAFRYTKDHVSTEMCNSTCAFFPDADPFCFALTEGSGTFAHPWASVLAQHWAQHPFTDVELTLKQGYVERPYFRPRIEVQAWLDVPSGQSSWILTGVR